MAGTVKVTRLPVYVKSIGTARAASPDAAIPRNAVPTSKIRLNFPPLNFKLQLYSLVCTPGSADVYKKIDDRLRVHLNNENLLVYLVNGEHKARWSGGLAEILLA